MTKNKIDFANLEVVLQNSLAKGKKHEKSRNTRYGVIYTRVSSKEQADNNGSLETQLAQCQEYAKRTGIIVKQCFGGTYDSAKTDGRKDFQRMLSFVKKDKTIAFIIVWNYERFSRTGAGAMQLSQNLRKEGVHLKSITEELDTSTASGRMMENFHHIKNFWDNDTKSERTKKMTREVMLKGYWPYTTPLGYKNLKPKHRACYHEYVITEEGKLLKKAFEWKAKGDMSNQQIVEKLSLRGLRLTTSNFRWVLSNVFYAGYITGSLVDRKLIKGQHKPLVDLETFLKANEMLSDACNAGVPKLPKHEEVPLKVFAKEHETGSPLTGYKTKGNWYYKARNKGVAVNIRASMLNEKFEEFLSGFHYNKAFHKTLKSKLVTKLRERLEDTIADSVLLKKRETELQNQIEKLEERFILGELKSELYEKYDKKYREQLMKIKAELTEKSFDSSNLEKAVEKMLAMAENLSRIWASEVFDVKQKLQNLVFPEGILYNKEKNTVRTTKINSLFAEIPLLKRDLEKKKNGSPIKNYHLNYPVPGTGIEPAHPCERQILSLLRLPSR
jgi:site-specific DNA recombinase